VNLDLLLLIGAAVCFGLAAFGVNAGRVSLMPLGLLLWVLAQLV
jgi:hypothetical protein